MVAIESVPDPRRASRILWVVCLGALLAGRPGVAQQEAVDLPGPELRLDVATGLVVSDNIERARDPAGVSSVSDTRFDLVYDTRTRSQRFTLEAGATLEFGAYADRETADPGLKSPFFSVAYLRESRGAALALQASYRLVDNGLERTVAADPDGEGNPRDLIVDQGTRATSRFEASLALGRDAPLGYAATLRYAERRYFDTTDPDLTDRRTLSFDQALRASLSRTTGLVFDLDYSERDEDDAEATFERNVAALVGLDHRTAGGLTASARFGYSVEEITRTRGGRRKTDRQDSPVLTFSLAQARPNGEITAALTRSLGEQGTRTTLRLGRELELPRGRLEADLGATVGETDEELRLVGRLAYDRPTRRGGLTLRLSQEVTSDEDTDYLLASADIGYRHELTRLSQISLTLGLSASEAVDPDETDYQRTRLEVAYSRRLTEEWRLNAGIRHLTGRESDRDPTVENALFANLSRRFDLLR